MYSFRFNEYNIFASIAVKENLLVFSPKIAENSAFFRMAMDICLSQAQKRRSGDFREKKNTDNSSVFGGHIEGFFYFQTDVSGKFVGNHHRAVEQLFGLMGVR